jgi:imidazolonepropionase-like amidohydrolase
MGNQIGSIAPGLQADIIALDGDPLKTLPQSGASYL